MSTKYKVQGTRYRTGTKYRDKVQVQRTVHSEAYAFYELLRCPLSPVVLPSGRGPASGSTGKGPGGETFIFTSLRASSPLCHTPLPLSLV